MNPNQYNECPLMVSNPFMDIASMIFFAPQLEQHSTLDTCETQSQTTDNDSVASSPSTPMMMIHLITKKCQVPNNSNDDEKSELQDVAGDNVGVAWDTPTRNAAIWRSDDNPNLTCNMILSCTICAVQNDIHSCKNF